jgi:hypothetical protein
VRVLAVAHVLELDRREAERRPATLAPHRSHRAPSASWRSRRRTRRCARTPCA